MINAYTNSPTPGTTDHCLLYTNVSVKKRTELFEDSQKQNHIHEEFGSHFLFPIMSGVNKAY
jgi:hypothetical protein